MDVLERLKAALAGRYQVQRELGAGGMAAVYLAHDDKHGRDVAIKVLHPDLGAALGGDRFLSEIRTTARLQHPHILPLLDSGEADGLLYYVMPVVTGETLRARLDREHQLPIPESLRIASEVASALDYAHRQGVVHRDIKPENILLHDGQALVADFGIALAVQTAGGQRMTQTGLSLGTPSYMSPEQAMGEKSIDARSDVYSLGAVTYEMLTGDAPFTGSTVQAVVAKVLSADAERPTLLRKTIPAPVEMAVLTALAKLPADRFATAAEFKDALNRTDAGPFATTSSAAASSSTPSMRSRSRRALAALPWALAVLGLAASAWVLTRRATAPIGGPVSKFALRFSVDVATGRPGQAIAMSPDGSRIVFVGTIASGTQLFVRNMNEIAAVPVPGTANAMSPFFSPDGEQIGFVIGSRLMKLGIAGGPAVPITDVGTTFRGGTWSAADTIVFADERGLQLVPAAGGQATLLAGTNPASPEAYNWPEFLPGDRDVVFSINDGNADKVAAMNVASRKITRFTLMGANPHYVDRGYLTIATIEAGSGGVVLGTVMAVPFDPSRLRTLGAPVPVADSVQVGLNSRTAKMGASRGGALAYASGAVGMSDLVAIKSTGAVTVLTQQAKFYGSPRVSPDGRRIAATVNDVGTDIWILDLSAHTLSRLTFDRTAQRPAWSPDGTRIAYDRRSKDGLDLAWIAADGSAPAESLTIAPEDQMAEWFAPNGRSLVVAQVLGGRRGLRVVQVDSARTPQPLLQSTSQSFSPTLSPDGKWMAYVSDETGRFEIYVRPFPGPGGRWQVSRDGGSEPRWSPTGKEIFFRAGLSMMAASVQTGAQFMPGAVRELFKTPASTSTFRTNYDVSRDGQTFYMVQPRNSNDLNVVVLLNWFDHVGARTR